MAGPRGVTSWCDDVTSVVTLSVTRGGSVDGGVRVEEKETRDSL